MSKVRLMDIYRSTVGKKSLKESVVNTVRDLENDDEIQLQTNSQDIAATLDQIGYGENGQYFESLFVRFTPDGDIDTVYGCENSVPHLTDPVWEIYPNDTYDSNTSDDLGEYREVLTRNLNRLIEVSHNRYTPVKTDFGGFRNIETQKIASSLMENHMESAISTFMRGYRGNQPYRDFIQSRALSGSGTKYGINWIDQRLDYRALNEEMRNLAEAYGLHPDVINQYLETALWSSGDGDLENLDSEYDIHDIAPESKKEAERDIEKMIDMAEKAGVLDPYLNAFTGDSWGNFGHDFWLTRNGHGAGFWDRSEIDDTVGKKLTDLAQTFGEAHPMIGDDGKIYIQRG